LLIAFKIERTHLKPPLHRHLEYARRDFLSVMNHCSRNRNLHGDQYGVHDHSFLIRRMEVLATLELSVPNDIRLSPGSSTFIK
jgi:hypothetical protein